MAQVLESIRGTDILNYIENLDDEQKSRTAGYYLAKQKSYFARDKVLMKYKWGMGIEHETQFIFVPDLEKKFKNNFILCNFLPEVLKMLKSGLLTYENYDFLRNIPFELTGRKCNKKYVIKPVPIKMPEFVTSDPFSDVIYGKRFVDEYYFELIERELKFLNVMKDHKKGLGSVCTYPYGMSNNLKILENYEKGKKTEPIKYKDYTGSYHFTLTLPFLQKDKYTKNDEKDFLNRHKNFALLFQWIEPLICATFFSVDSDIIDEPEKRTHGSYRVLMTGWGNFGGSDVKQFETGIGRYAVHPTYWRENIDDKEYKDLKKLKKCDENPHPQEKQSVSMLSSNIRTFGAPDPDRPWHRESGAKMNIPNGLEFRIFDNFNPICLIYLLRLIVFLAEHSTHHKCSITPYNDDDWKDMLKKVMKDGWRAEISESYNEKIEKIFGFKIKKKSETLVAYDYLNEILENLYNMNKKGDIVYMMLRSESVDISNKLPNINRRSWEFAFDIKLLSDKKQYNNFEKMCDELSKTKTKYDEKTLKIISKYFNKNMSEDILFYLESKKIIQQNPFNKYFTISLKSDFRDMIFINIKKNFFPLNILIYYSFYKLGIKNEKKYAKEILSYDFSYFNTRNKNERLFNILVN